MMCMTYFEFLLSWTVGVVMGVLIIMLYEAIK